MLRDQLEISKITVNIEWVIYNVQYDTLRLVGQMNLREFTINVCASEKKAIDYLRDLVVIST